MSDILKQSSKKKEDVNDDSLEYDEEEEKQDLSKNNMFYQSDISRSLSTLTFDTVITEFNKTEFILPKFQRKYVWDKEKITQLVVSLIKGIPIPPIYAYVDDNNRYVVLDGQQRLVSLFLYYCNLIPKKTVCIDFSTLMSSHEETPSKPLSEILLEQDLGSNFWRRANTENFKKVKEIYNKKDNTEISDKQYKKIKDYKYIVGTDSEEMDITYACLTDKEKRGLGRCSIDVNIIEVRGNDRESVCANIFRLLNAETAILSDQEIRNGAYASPLYDMLFDLNNDLLESNKIWLGLYKNKHKHDRDMERLLRLLTLRHFIKRIDNNFEFITEDDICVYNGNMSQLLDKYSQWAVNEFKLNNPKINTDILKDNIINYINSFDSYEWTNKPNRRLIFTDLYIIYNEFKGNIKFTKDLMNIIYGLDEYMKYLKNPNSKNDILNRLQLLWKEIGRVI